MEQNETKRNKIKPNESKRIKMKQNETKRNKTKQNETKRIKMNQNETKRNKAKQSLFDCGVGVVAGAQR
jgi:hypothetical protein